MTFNLENSRFGVWGPRRLLRGFQFHPPSRKTAAWTVVVGPYSRILFFSDGLFLFYSVETDRYQASRPVR